LLSASSVSVSSPTSRAGGCFGVTVQAAASNGHCSPYVRQTNRPLRLRARNRLVSTARCPRTVRMK
jgi:hypothetical protein